MVKPPRVLVVEDTEALQRVLQDILFSYETTAASSLLEASEYLREGDFACALIDLGLPDGNGLELLPTFREHNPCGVAIIMTGDGRAETIVEAMRAGAYDYLMKPIDVLSVQTAVERAFLHHAALLERDELVRLLEEERRQLQVRVERATADIRQYATHCEVMNARLSGLVSLAQTCSELHTDEELFRLVLAEIGKYLPVRCIALIASASGEFVGAFTTDSDEIRVVASQCHESGEFSENSETLIVECLAQYAGFDAAALTPRVFTQTSWGRVVCHVAFLLEKDFVVDEACGEFLSMSAHFLATEWQEAQLFHYAAHRATLGNMAVEVSHHFIQALTAIQTAGEAVAEMEMTPDAKQGLSIIAGNVEKLRGQLDEFRQLAHPQKGNFMTVELASSLDEVLKTLGPVLESRKVALVKEFTTPGRCILLNVSTLTWTLVNLVSNAVLAVGAGNRVALRLQEVSPEAIEFAIVYDGAIAGQGTGSRRLQSEDPQVHPTFFLAQRTIRSCGGRLIVDKDKEGCWNVRVVLPRDPVNTVRIEA